MRVIFVGIHNKPGMLPLDSATKTGKTIDEIILLFNSQEIEFVKTNLFEVDYLPESKKTRKSLKNTWLKRYQPEINDIVITLGNLVKKEMPEVPYKISFKHPAAIYKADERMKYINDVSSTINIFSPIPF